MTREEAIKELESYADHSWGGLSEAFELAIAALREQEERSKGCGWCKQFAGVPLRGFTEHGCQSITVKFCPMCGRRLEEV